MQERKYVSISLFSVSITCWALCSGCEFDNKKPDASTAIKDHEFISNGFSINGFSINGFSINGFSINGSGVNGFNIDGFSKSGVGVSGVALNGSAFKGVAADGSSLSGVDFIGVQLQLTVQPAGQPQPSHYTLKFDNIYADPKNLNGDVLLYDVSYLQNGDTNWRPLCLDGAGQATAMIPLRNSWDMRTGARIDDANAITFACVSGALGKCVRIGYRPWGTAARCPDNAEPCTNVSLTDYHQACTRMIRADYCGIGVSYTINGTLIDVFDELSPAIQTEAADWSLEAKWGPDGAACVTEARHLELIAAGKRPDCENLETSLSSCGESRKLKGALLGNTYVGGALKDHLRPRLTM